MKRRTVGTLVLSIATIFTAFAMSQPPGGRRGSGGRGANGPDGRPPHNRVLEALDGDGNHEISATELAEAVAALKKLDSNKDGKLSENELHPHDGPQGREGGPRGRRGPGAGGPEGPGGRGRGRGPGGPRGNQAGAEGMIARLMSFDKNGDDKLSKDELPERMQNILGQHDANNDGAIDRSELAKLASNDDEGEEGSGRRGFRGGGRGFGGPGRGGPGFGGPGRGGPGFGGPGRGGPPSPEQFVNDIMEFDADKDGKLSKAELLKAGQEMMARGPGGPGGRGSEGRGGGRGPRRRDGGADGGERPRRPRRPGADDQ